MLTVDWHRLVLSLQVLGHFTALAVLALILVLLVTELTLLLVLSFSMLDGCITVVGQGPIGKLYPNPTGRSGLVVWAKLQGVALAITQAAIEGVCRVGNPGKKC